MADEELDRDAAWEAYRAFVDASFDNQYDTPARVRVAITAYLRAASTREPT